MRKDILSVHERRNKNCARGLSYEITDNTSAICVYIRHYKQNLTVGQRSRLFTEIKSQDFLAIKPLNNNLLLRYWLPKCFNRDCIVLLSQGVCTSFFAVAAQMRGLADPIF